MPGELVKAVLERALESELTAHLGYGRHERGGSIAKTVQTGMGPVPLQVPGTGRARSSRSWSPSAPGASPAGLDDMVISLYAHVISSLG